MASRGQERRAAFAIYASVQFVVLTIAAMVVYPGGAVYQLASGHYLFLQNFFSDLGATRTPSGRSNLASHVLFVIALGSVGVAMIQFSPAWKVLVARRSAGKGLGIVSQGAAVVAGLGFIGVAATPWNHVLDAHNAFVQLAFGVLLVWVACLLVMQFQNRWPMAFTVINAVYVVLLLAYVGVLVAGPRLDTAGGLEVQVAAQKVIVYASVVNIGIQAWAIRLEALVGGALRRI